LAAARALGSSCGRGAPGALAAFEELYAELATIGVDQELAACAGAHAEDLGYVV
jgi:hypothetical protein